MARDTKEVNEIKTQNVSESGSPFISGLQTKTRDKWNLKLFMIQTLKLNKHGRTGYGRLLKEDTSMTQT